MYVFLYKQTTNHINNLFDFYLTACIKNMLQKYGDDDKIEL